jgi:mitochondrial fission protein ELM1
MTNLPKQPMAGLAAWIISLDRIGNLTQARGLAGALGLDVTMKLIAPTGVFALCAPFGPPPPADRFGKPGSLLAPPWPPVTIGIGRSAVPYLRAVKRAAGRRTFAIMMMDPRFHHRDFDVVWIPEHDQRSGANILTTPFSMHSFSPERLDDLRRNIPAAVLALPSPRVTVVLGGRNKVFDYPDSDHQRLTRSLRSMAQLGCSFLVTPSRRSHPELIAAAVAGTEGAPRIVWDGRGDNPYGQFLAAADHLVVTGDSANMTSEALATGKPLHVFVPHGTAGKFKLLHDALYATGSARPLGEEIEALESWPTHPQYATDIIAREVERRWLLAMERT